MRLTVRTDYALRVLIYLSLDRGGGGIGTIDEIADAYRISRSHLKKVVNELAQHGVLETARGRAGGVRLALDPSRISIGEIVRLVEKDFAVVECHDAGVETDCAIAQVCNLRRVLRRAVDAFMYELDKATLADAAAAPSVVASILGIGLPADGVGPGAAARRRQGGGVPVDPPRSRVRQR